MRQALGVAILSVNVRDTQGFFEHCGYGILGFPRRVPPLYNLASSKSLFGKVHAHLASRFSSRRRIIATLMYVSLVCTFRS